MAAELSSGLLAGYLLDGKGGGRALVWKEVQSWKPSMGPLWIHLDTQNPAAEAWLRRSSGLVGLACDALLAGETRPRCASIGEGLLVFLRGVNLNPGADPEDMVSLRIWGDSTRLISLGRRRLSAIQDLAEELEEGVGPSHAAGLLTSLTGHLLQRMEPAHNQLDEAVDDLEERALGDDAGNLQDELAEIRRQIISLRRHLAPQREAMLRFAHTTVSFIDEASHAELQIHADQWTRYVEGLEALRDRATVTYDLLKSRQADVMNRRMLVLSVVTAVFLPLGLITGLLGVNVGGIPGASSEGAFVAVCVLMLCVGALEAWAFKRMKWW